MFERVGGQWPAQETIKLFANDGSIDDKFGFSVAIDGLNIIVGAPEDAVLDTRSGSAYIFSKEEGDWQLAEKIIVFDGDVGIFDQFGSSVSINGNRTAVGALADSPSMTR